MNKEIEVRYELFNISDWENWLIKNAIYKGEINQTDIYFDSKTNSFIKDCNHIYKWLRLRIEDEKEPSINFKHWLPEGSVIRRYAKEIEFNVSNADLALELLENLDYSELVTVNKLRKIWQYKDIEISIDIVKNLGNFIELEYKGFEDIVLAEGIKKFGYFVDYTGLTVGKEDNGGYGFKILSKKL